MRETRPLRIARTEICNSVQFKGPDFTEAMLIYPSYDLTVRIYLKSCQIQGILGACVVYIAFREKECIKWHKPQYWH